MSKIASKYVSWKVLFDGVEVPWLSFSIGVGVDMAGQATVVLEPDPVLNEIRPRTNVAFFFYDNFQDGADDLDKYKLYWEGEMEGYSYNKVAQGRSVTVSAEGMFSVFGRSKLFALGFGAIPMTPHISGSLFAAESVTLSQLFNFAIFGKAFDPTNKCASFSLDELPTGPAYGDRLLSLMAFLSGYNANFRMQAVRTRLFGRIASIPDRTIGRLVPRSMISQYSQQMVEGSIPPDSSLADLIGMFNRTAFHHYASTVAPHVPVGVKNTSVYLPGSTPEDSIYAISRPYLRNDYIFMPEMYYAVPPACNFIFPEFLQSLNVQRSFTSEPTRALMHDQNLGGGSLVVVAPDEILRFEKVRPDPAQFWSLNRDGIKVEGKTDSPYHTISKGGTAPFNLFGAVTDQEIEKGIIPHSEDLPFEYFSAVSNLYDVSKESLDKLASKTQSLESILPKIERETSKQTGYIYLVKALADYLLFSRRFRRSVTAELIGHRWIVPGFPCVIFDTMMSYIGYVRACTVSVNADGSESTSLNLDYVRSFPRVSPPLETVRLRDALQSLNSVKAVSDSTEAAIKKQGDKIDAYGKILDTCLHAGVPYTELAKADYQRTFSDAFAIVEKDETKARRMGISRDKLKVLKKDLDDLLSIDPSSRGVGVDATEAQAKTLNDSTLFLSSFYWDCSKQANESASGFNEAAVPMTPGVQPQIDTLRSTIAKADLKGLFPEDFFAPPVFGNMDFLDIEKAEKIYAGVIGSSPALTKLSNKSGTDPYEVTKGTAGGVLALKLNSYNKFVNLTDAIQKIFPIFNDDGTTEWSQHTKDGGRDVVSARDWIEQTYLRREGLMSLRQYAEANLLNPQTWKSTTPFPQSFLVLAPLTTRPVYSDKLKEILFWDNSIYSKIVDEFEISPRPYKITVESSGAIKTVPSKTKDTVIEELKRSVSLSSLTTTNRQSFWVSYAQNHHGSRAFVGR